MRYRTLAQDPKPLSVLAMGTHMNLGYSLDDAESQALVDTAIEGGITLFDTADAYADGAAEAALGRCLKNHDRDRIWILTKVGASVSAGKGLSPEHIRRQIDASLERLDTGYVDIYLCHHEDPDASSESIAETMHELIEGGKVRHWGVSNWSPERLEHANDYARASQLHPMTVCQPRYSLLYRHPEAELFPLLLQEGILATTFSPLAHGVLAGIYTPGQPPAEGTRAAMAGENQVTMDLYYNEENLVKAQELKGLARSLGTTAAALATAWCAAHPAVASVILGAWNAREMAENLRAADLELNADIRTRLEVLFPRM